MGVVSSMFKGDDQASAQKEKEIVSQMSQTIECPLHDAGARPRRKTVVAIFSLPGIASATSASTLDNVARVVTEAVEHDFEVPCPLCQDRGEVPQSVAYALFSLVERAERNHASLVSARR